VSFDISAPQARSYTAPRMFPDLSEFLYCSELAPQVPIEVVGRIAGRARARNARDGITGLLVFDGIRFCQHVEGPRDAVRALLQRLEADPRHTAMKLLHQGPLAQRRYPRFEIGMADVGEREALGEMRLLYGAEAVERFFALRPNFDIAG
jgi:Sensors of blue-light using FAD